MEITASLVHELREASGAGMMDCKKALTECDGSIEAAMDYLREKGFAKAEKKGARIAAEGLANIYIEKDKAVILEVNSETDFVSKNEEFTSMLDTIGNAILKNEVTDLNSALEIKLEDGTINDLIVAKTAKIGEKLSLRRLEIVTKNANEVFGSYLHMGGRIAVLTVLENTTEEVARDVAMQSAAMKPNYVFIEDVPSDVIDHEREILKEQSMNEGKPADIAEKMVEGRLKKFYKEICLAEQAFIKDGDISVNTYVSNNGGKIKTMIRYEVGEGIEKRNDDFASEVMNQVNSNN